ncbi:MAG: hypothetical protein ACFE8U_02000 [Candidatus Hermodarchaeota archaeon]
MSNEDPFANIKEFLAQKYLLSPDETVEAVNQCASIIETLSSEDFPEKDFYIRILQHFHLFLNSEFKLQRKRLEKALQSYQKLQKHIIETQTQFPDLYSSWRFDIDRLLLRVDARIQEVRALVALANNDTVQAEVLYVETINRYNTELQLEQERSDYDHYFDSLGNIFQTTGNLHKLRGNNTKNPKELYQAIKNFKKAKFLGIPNLDETIKETHEMAFTLTLGKLENQAESLFNKGLVASEAEQYKVAKNNYQKSAQLYSALRQKNPSIEYELQEQIQYSSYNEAAAKDFMTQDDNEQAAIQFSHASQTLLNVLQKLPTEALKQQFDPQINYFQAMQLFCKAVTEYDKMIPEAMNHFKEAKQKIEETKIKAEETENTPLINSCNDALNKLNSYLEISELMFQSETN